MPWWYWVILLVGPGSLCIGCIMCYGCIEDWLEKRRAPIVSTSSFADLSVAAARGEADATADQRASSSSAGADMTVSAMADLLRERLGLSANLNIAQVADAAAEKMELKLAVDISLKDKLGAAVEAALQPVLIH